MLQQVQQEELDFKLTRFYRGNFCYRYGWYTDPGLDCDRGDRRLYFPRQESQMVKIKSLIDHADSVTKSQKL